MNSHASLILFWESLEQHGSLLYYTNGSYKIPCWVLCCAVFKFSVKLFMDYGIRSGKSLILGIPKAYQGNIQGHQKPKLADSPGRHPLFRLRSLVTLLGAIFLFATWYVFCLERLVWFESLIFSFPQSYLLFTPFGRSLFY